MTKLCCACKEQKPLDSFANKTASKDGKQSRCNPCMVSVMKKRYLADTAEWNRKSREQKQRKYDWINDYKVSKTCLVCSEVDYACLEFHHLDGEEKEATISQMVANKVSDEKILLEIDKCIVICSNHHRQLHAGHIACEIF